MGKETGMVNGSPEDFKMVIERGGTLAAINAELGSLAEQVAGSLVRVEAGRRGAGAGVVVHQEGLIVTNAHVARGRRLEVVDRQGRRWPATVRSWQGRWDLAALTLEEDAELPGLPLGDSKRLLPGSWVLAMGYPFGISGGATAGVVIGVGDQLPEVPSGGQDWLAMSLHLRPGHSGGPVINAAGQLVGLNTRMAGPEVGLAVPSHVISHFLKVAFSNNRGFKMDNSRIVRNHWL